ncbi:MAG: hypothetical protein FWC51_00835 [Proteobacteria bacterium]|nr:hypothetical protein [Pseudomonadota bacterium]
MKREPKNFEYSPETMAAWRAYHAAFRDYFAFVMNNDPTPKNKEIAAGLRKNSLAAEEFYKNAVQTQLAQTKRSKR